MLVKDLGKAKTILRAVNWDFFEKGSFSSGETRPFKPSAHHWYPATFVPEIPFTLIEVLTKEEATVYDPFGGIGTTYFQALALNRKPLTTEINRVAVDFMRSLCTLLSPTTDVRYLARRVAGIVKEYDKSRRYARDVHRPFLAQRLRPWYSEQTFNALSYLSVQEEKAEDDALRATIRISTSAILKTVCSQDRGWGCISDNVLPRADQIKDKDALGHFKGHADRLLADIAAQPWRKTLAYSVLHDDLSQRPTVIHAAAEECAEIDEETVDLVVTSPPYPNMTDYVNSQRLCYYYMGLDPSVDLGLEIGARIKRFRKDALEQYLAGMQRANKAVAKKLRRGGYACFVMPEFSDSQNNRERRVIVQRVLAGIEQCSLTREEEFERLVPSNRRAHNSQWAKLERERIFLFRKP